MASTSCRELDRFPADLAHATWYTASWYPAKVTKHNEWQVAALEFEFERVAGGNLQNFSGGNALVKFGER